VDVFTSGDGLYFCYKIPSMMQTQDGTLLAFAEGRNPTCSDFASTDLVYKRSDDLGKTWSSLRVLYSNSTTEESNVIGNAAPVQIASSGRILVPFCRNNHDVLLTYSDDDGKTWSTPRDISSQATRPTWAWIGTGPPASLQLQSGRIITPSYHTLPLTPAEDGELSEGHVLYSDDMGETWQLSDSFGRRYLSNECQAVQLDSGDVLINARTRGLSRYQTLSHDDGVTFDDGGLVDELREPVSGCEMSMVRNGTMLWFSGPTEPSLYRQNMTLWKSTNQGNSWSVARVIDSGPSGYSSLAMINDRFLGILYERASENRVVFVPEHISFTLAWL